MSSLFLFSNSLKFSLVINLFRASNCLASLSISWVFRVFSSNSSNLRWVMENVPWNLRPGCAGCPGSFFTASRSTTCLLRYPFGYSWVASRYPCWKNCYCRPCSQVHGPWSDIAWWDQSSFQETKLGEWSTSALMETEMQSLTLIEEASASRDWVDVDI